MLQKEFNTQIFRTNDQWDSGLTFRLEKLERGGITLFSTPTFSQWISEEKGVKDPGVLAIDDCGSIYYLERKTCKLFRYYPEIKSRDLDIKRLEYLPCISGKGTEPGEVNEPRRILFGRSTMWILDANRIQAFSKENFQIRYIIDDLEKPTDMALDKSGNIYVLENKDQSFNIITYDTNGQRVDTKSDKSPLEDPVGLAAGKDKNLYVLDRKLNKFFKFIDGKWSEPFGDLSGITYLKPGFVIDRNGNIFIPDEKGSIYQFDPDGGFLGIINIPDFSDKVEEVAVDSKGNLYVSSSKGIAFLITKQKYTKEPGVYFSKTLDSGIQECQWHRLAIDAEIPQKSILEIYFYCSDDKILKDQIDDLIGLDKETVQEKTSILDKKLQWIGPEKYISSEEIKLNVETNQPDPKSNGTKEVPRNNKLIWVGSKKNPKNILFRGTRGRYLWLKIVLLTFDESVRPAITEMKVIYPRNSYLRYLPAIYQEDPSSMEFLERFLSIFETVFNDLETEISNIFKYFDPDTTPENFISWLASWMNMALDEGWEEEKKREFIRKAFFLYKFKGTPSGIEKIIEIYTGKKPIILENWKIGTPLVLDGRSSFMLGINSLVLQTPIRGFRIGYDSILGRVALREVVQLPEDPFLLMAHKFTVILDLSNEEFTTYAKGLEMILNDEKPAHTSFDLRIINEMRMGSGTYVGINTKVGGYRPLYLGNSINEKSSSDRVDNTIGFSVLSTREKHGSRVERRSRLGYDIELT